MSEKTRPWFRMILRIGGVLAAIMGVIAGVLAITAYLQNRTTVNVTGWWELTNTVESTSYPKYEGMQLTYRIFLQQDRTQITGKGEKWLEDGEEIEWQFHSPISIEGKAEGRTLTASFEEKGTSRTTCGNFVWTVSADGNKLEGTFTHTAANSNGSSIGRRIK